MKWIYDVKAVCGLHEEAWEWPGTTIRHHFLKKGLLDLFRVAQPCLDPLIVFWVSFDHFLCVQ